MAEKMTDMALSAKDVKESSPGLAVASAKNAPRYPWGTTLNLGSTELKKLKIADLPKVGSYVEITAYACVKSVRESEQVDGDKDRSVELQIESMSVTPAKARAGKAVGKGYKK